ncbi:MAG TPA: excinuclease ABC subunit UvrC [Acidimicrobiia bacterium]|nr:excinuclease ABC subunit UvrC [Acidimicrobiia bacterium]
MVSRPEPGSIPDAPGSYQFLDTQGRVIYVGKAKSLRSRLSNYFVDPDLLHERTRQMVLTAETVEWIVAKNEVEAFFLEFNLIKQHKPRFNIRLKDDKSYPFIKVTLADEFPRIERTRKLPADGSRYFGPYASASSVDAAMDLIRRLFPFRTCTIDIHEGQRALPRPCLLYDIKRCQGPCIEAIDRASYRREIDQVMLFLEGRHDVVSRQLTREMTEASTALDYERAADLRDQLRAIERTTESQKMAAFARTQQDVLGLARSDAEAAVQLFVIRDGRMIGRDVFPLRAVSGLPDEEVLGAFVRQYYAASGMVPPRILVPYLPAEVDELTAFLAERRGGAVAFAVPRRGEKRDLVDLAARNAAEALAREQTRRMADQGQALVALGELADALGLPAPPQRIEGYDISNIQGTDAVGSMVVFEDGRPAPSRYRRFRIRTVVGANDFASHQEVLRRRFRRIAVGTEVDESIRWSAPDLVVIDGGKGQVAAAREVLEELGQHDLPLVGIAKEREELFVPGAREPIVLPASSPGLYLLQRVRDESHRFAITYHRSLRGRRQTRSALDAIPGVGPKRKRALLRAFGSVRGVREAAMDEIAAVPGIGHALAAGIKEALTV